MPCLLLQLNLSVLHCFPLILVGDEVVAGFVCDCDTFSGLWQTIGWWILLQQQLKRGWYNHSQMHNTFEEVDNNVSVQD